MRCWRGLCALLTFGGLALSAHTAQLGLRLSYSGALVEGQVKTNGPDTLTGVWSSVGRARLLRCSPRCVTVADLPVNPVLYLGGSSPYRVVLGGAFHKGQKVGLTFRFRSGAVLNTQVLVQP